MMEFATMAKRKSPRKPKYRVEHDLLGKKSVPASAYYGVQTMRGMENFSISGVPISHYPDLIRAFAMVKLAAARANHEVGAMPRRVLKGIEAACQDLIDGNLHDEFRLDVFQGGAGTSTNMAANEVIANRALEHMGYRKGEYAHCDPHDHVNMSQSTNDAYPTALARGGPVDEHTPDERTPGAGRGVPGQVQGVPNRRQDGAHPASGCRAHDTRAGVRRVRRQHRRRGAHAPRGRTRAVRGQHGRHRNRHRAERPARLRAQVRHGIWRRSRAGASRSPTT
jgi:hypothetical protein